MYFSLALRIVAVLFLPRACLSTVTSYRSYPSLTIPASCSLALSHFPVHHPLFLHLPFEHFPMAPCSSRVIILP